jgi:hypothetical protein
MSLDRDAVKNVESLVPELAPEPSPPVARINARARPTTVSATAPDAKNRTRLETPAGISTV